jgi:hypothetical protein
MKHGNDDYKKIKRVDPDKAKREHERKLYSRKMTLFGPDPETWDLQDHTLKDVSREGRTDAVDAFEKELRAMEDD